MMSNHHHYKRKAPPPVLLTNTTKKLKKSNTSSSSSSSSSSNNQNPYIDDEATNVDYSDNDMEDDDDGNNINNDDDDDDGFVTDTIIYSDQDTTTIQKSKQKEPMMEEEEDEDEELQSKTVPYIPMKIIHSEVFIPMTTSPTNTAVALNSRIYQHQKYPVSEEIIDLYHKIVTGTGCCHSITYENCSNEKLYNVLEHVRNIYFFPDSIDDRPREQTRCRFIPEYAWRIFNLIENDENTTFQAIIDRCKLLNYGICQLQFLCGDRNILDVPVATHPNIGYPRSFLSKVQHVLYGYRDIVMKIWSIQACFGNYLNASIPQSVRLVDFYGLDQEIQQKSEYQQCIAAIIEMLHRDNLRKKGQYCYEEQKVYISDLNHPIRCRQYGTRSWYEKCTIENYIYRKMDENSFFMDKVTTKMNMVPQLVSFFEKAEENTFPTVNASRYMFAFKNGIFHAYYNIFMQYTESPEQALGELDPEYIATMTDDEKKKTELIVQYSECLRDLRQKDCCHYIPQDYDLKWESYVDNEKKDDGFMDIPTPAMDKILDHQRFNYEIKKWIFILIGRMLYDVGVKDEWQVLLFIRGIGGTGKSTIGRVLKRFYAEPDVAQLSNNCEPQFGLETVYNKYMWLCLEAKENFKLEQAQLQSMTSGEPMMITRKHKEALSIPQWKPPGMIMGNVVPSWVNYGGGISRRILLLDFEYGVSGKDNDPSLFQKLNAETAALIVKSSAAYSWAIEKFKGRGIWDIIPDYFKEKQDELDRQTNSLLYFITSSGVCELWSKDLVPPIPYNDFCIEKNTFEQQYSSWCNKNGRRKLPLNDEQNVRATLARSGIGIDKNDKITPGCRRSGGMTYFRGIRLNEDMSGITFSSASSAFVSSGPSTSSISFPSASSVSSSSSASSASSASSLSVSGPTMSYDKR